MRRRLIGGTAIHSGAEGNTVFGPVLLDLVRGQQEAILYSNDYTLPNLANGLGAMITADGRYFIFGVVGGIRALDLDTNTLVTPFAVPPTGVIYDITQRKTDGLIAIATSSAPFVFLYTYPGFEYVPGPAAINPPPSTALTVDFTDDGTRLCVGHTTLPGVMVYDTSTWANTLPTLATAPTSATALNGACISPDGTKVAICGRNSGNRNRVWNMSTGALIYSETTTNSGYIVFTADSSQIIWQAESLTFRRYNFSTSTASTFAISGVSGLGTANPSRNMEITDDGLLFAHFRGVSVFYDYVNNVLLSQVPNENAQSAMKAALFPGTTRRRLAGNVLDAGLDPAERKLEAYDMASGRFLGAGVSDPVTGDFEFPVYSPALCYVVAEGIGGEQSKIISGITPALP